MIPFVILILALVAVLDRRSRREEQLRKLRIRQALMFEMGLTWGEISVAIGREDWREMYRLMGRSAWLSAEFGVALAWRRT